MFVDMDRKSLSKICSIKYLVMGKDETLSSTATLLSDNHGCYKYADVDRDIEAGEDKSESTAKMLFGELLEIHLDGQIS